MEHVLLQIYLAIQKILYSQINQETFTTLISNSNVLERDGKGIKVVETVNQDIVKLFRLKRIYSSAFFSPYALRFLKNARKLQTKGIETVAVKKIEYCLSEQRHILTYKKITGQSIKELLTKDGKDTELIKKLISFIASLHEKGVYFRSLHAGNIIVSHNGEMALIDIADLKVYPWSLTTNQRIRNWRHFLKYTFEKRVVNSFGLELFFDAYVNDTHLSQRQKGRLKAALMDYF